MAKNRFEFILTAIDRSFTRTIKKAGGIVKAFGREAEGAGKRLHVFRDGMESVSKGLARMEKIASAGFFVGGTGLSAKAIIDIADAMKNLDHRLLITAKHTEDYAKAQKTVVDVARETHTSVQDVATLYTRMAGATANLNVNQGKLAEITRTVSKAVSISGASAQEASNALLQFAQAMGSNRLGGDELRSVLEQLPSLTKVFVDAAGGSMATLREMAEGGKLTTEWMIEAISAAKDEIESQAAMMPKTVGRAITDLKNEFSFYLAELDSSTGATEKMAGAVSFLAKNIDTVLQAAIFAISIAIARLTSRGIAAAITGLAGFSRKLGAMTVATAQASSGLGQLNTQMLATGKAAGTVAHGSRLRLIPALLGMSNPISAITTALSVGVTAWQLWGKESLEAIDKAERKLDAIRNANKAKKEMANPDLAIRESREDLVEARRQLDDLYRKRAEALKAFTAADGSDKSAEATELLLLDKEIAKTKELYELRRKIKEETIAGREMDKESEEETEGVTASEERLKAEKKLADELYKLRHNETENALKEVEREIEAYREAAGEKVEITKESSAKERQIAAGRQKYLAEVEELRLEKIAEIHRKVAEQEGKEAARKLKTQQTLLARLADEKYKSSHTQYEIARREMEKEVAEMRKTADGRKDILKQVSGYRRRQLQKIGAEERKAQQERLQKFRQHHARRNEIDKRSFVQWRKERERQRGLDKTNAAKIAKETAKPEAQSTKRARTSTYTVRIPKGVTAGQKAFERQWAKEHGFGVQATDEEKEAARYASFEQWRRDRSRQRRTSFKNWEEARQYDASRSTELEGLKKEYLERKKQEKERAASRKRRAAEDQAFSEQRKKNEQSFQKLVRETAEKRKKARQEAADAAKSAARDRLAAEKKRAEVEQSNIEKQQTLYERYTAAVKRMQESILGREQSLREELAALDPRGEKTQGWQSRLFDAKKLERAARESLKKGLLTAAREQADRAREMYAGLKDGAKGVDGARAKAMAYSGVRQAGELGLLIERQIAGALEAKKVKQPVPAEKAATRTVELKFPGGRLHGDGNSVEALLRQLEQAGLSA